MINTKQLPALFIREFHDNKGGMFYAPLIIAGIGIASLILGLVLSGEAIQFQDFSFSKVSDKWAAMTADERLAASYFAAAGYLMSTSTLFVVLPFVIFFTLLGALYEERRDKSILFWKSMPVSDLQEVLVKYVASIFMVTAIFFVVSIVLQLLYATVTTIYFVPQGAPIAVLWPVMQMLETWVSLVPVLILIFLWASPIFAWLLCVSAFAHRIPFAYAVVPIVVVTILEQIVFKTTYFIEAVGEYVGVGFAKSVQSAALTINDKFKGPEDIVAAINDFSIGEMYIYTLTAPSFWIGLAIAAGFIYAATEKRRRSI